MEWRFKKLTPDDTLQNASHLEFFHNDALHSTVDALAREDIQNRLDARARNKPRVEVRYRLCGPVDAATRGRWFAGLASHLASPQVAEELGAAPSLTRSLKWLVIEDFETTGLEGDPLRFQDPDAGSTRPRNDFFWFIRNVGRSGKKGGDRGRWGLGKIVYPATSQVRSIFAYSIRQSDMQRHLIGRSVLAVHHLDGAQHDSEGYFGRFDDKTHTFFATPETDAVELDSFVADFRIQRKPTEPGLSVVIPWPEDDITMDNLVRSLIEHWFWVILEDRLVVRVTLDATGEEVVLSSDTLESVIRKTVNESTLEGHQLLRKLVFAREVHMFDIASPTFYSLTPCPAGSAPKWDDSEGRFPSEEAIATAREAYHAGRLVGFDIPVRVTKTGGGADEMASFEVYIQRSDGGEQATETFLRDGLTIAGQRFLREPGVCAIVKAEDNALGTLLGDAENPAHTRWERSGKHFRGRYVNGPSILLYIQRSAQHLCALLSRKPEGIDKDLLKFLFSVPEAGPLKTPGPKPKPGDDPDPPIPPIVAQNYFVECTKIPDGFRLRRHPKATTPPEGIQVRAAYDVLRGNPFKLHHPADFDLSRPNGIKIEMEGLAVTSAEPNRLMLAVETPDFEFTAVGFDAHRDLIVDVKPLHAALPGDAPLAVT
ncbi:MAG TPA: hypothetical protein VGG34_10495 [Opitutaceae bacterium]